jgi:hypothetical protein
MIRFACLFLFSLNAQAEDASMFSVSEHIIQEHVKKYKTGAAELKDLIQEVLHHPDFVVNDVDTNMH